MKKKGKNLFKKKIILKRKRIKEDNKSFIF